MSWFTVRCLFEWDRGTYEERIGLWQAESFDHAIELAEREAAEYSAETSTPRYLGLAQCYKISDSRPESGDEVFSLLRNSDLAPGDYISRFFDTGTEIQERS